MKISVRRRWTFEERESAQQERFEGTNEKGVRTIQFVQSWLSKSWQKGDSGYTITPSATTISAAGDGSVVT